MGFPIQIHPDTGLIMNIGRAPGTGRGPELIEEFKLNIPVHAVDYSGQFNTTAALAFCTGALDCGYEQGLNYETNGELHDWTYRCRAVEVTDFVINWCDAW
eukprot:SAG31_NODE_17944_length_652_cov_0.929476_2_plen_101_part_00